MSAEREKHVDIAAVAHSRANSVADSCSVTFSQFLPMFFAFRAVTRAHRTVSNERRRAKVLAKRFGGSTISDITVANIQDYVIDRSVRVSNRTINLELTFLRSLFKYAITRRFAQTNPAREVTNLPEGEDKEEVWIPTDKEFTKFVDEAGKVPNGKFMVPWIWFRAYTGTRPSESFFVEWQDIDFVKKQIVIRPKRGNPIKNRKKRIIPLNDNLSSILLEWRKEWESIRQKRMERYDGKDNGERLLAEHDWVFINPKKQGERANGFGKSFREARKKAGLPKMNSYTLRHYFASQCIRQGFNLFYIARWLGHHDLKMLYSVYGHLLPDYSAAEMNKLDLGSNKAA